MTVSLALKGGDHRVAAAAALLNHDCLVNSIPDHTTRAQCTRNHDRWKGSPGFKFELETNCESVMGLPVCRAD